MTTSQEVVASSTRYSWIPDNQNDVTCLCLGTGRFLRSVLVPAMVATHSKVGLMQTRGRSFLEFMLEKKEYQVDTILPNGKVDTLQVPCEGAFTLGSSQGMEEAMEFVKKQKEISIIGVGVTEAGLASSSSQGMICLYKLLQVLKERMVDQQTMTCRNPNGRVCIINTDNVPRSGQVIQSLQKQLASQDKSMMDFISSRIVFLNTMVDRITSHRHDDAMIPKCEPIPDKALVVLDPNGDLPPEWNSQTMQEKFGVVIRSLENELQQDVALKLRIANGTHTAMAHYMALCGMLQTSILSDQKGKLVLDYLDALFQNQILPGALCNFDELEIKSAYTDWRRRLCHGHFGLSTFFITQNGPAKGGIRLSPTMCDLFFSQKQHVSVAMAFAFAALLRWLTSSCPNHKNNGIYRGWLEVNNNNEEEETVSYADGLQYNLKEGWYEFRCACNVQDGLLERNLSDWLGDLLTNSKQPQAFQKVITAYLVSSDGGKLSAMANNVETKREFQQFCRAVATLYARMVAGDGMTSVLQEIANSEGPYKNGFSTNCSVLVDHAPDMAPLHYRANPIPKGSRLLDASIGTDQEVIASVVVSEVASALTIDLHTHLLPPSHGALCLWGIDELLTYHYLVAEYFMTAPSSMSPEDFYAMTKQQQADIIWKALFCDRSPVSEACRGVITTLVALGLQAHVHKRDLKEIRRFYTEKFRNHGLEGTERFSETVYSLSGVRYAIMTNIPFDANEAQHWRPKKKEYPARYRSALRVDPLLAGDQKTVETALKASGYPLTLEGARQYLRDWCDTMKPEYMMASTPHNFVLQEEQHGGLSGLKPKRMGVNEDAMKMPGAFADIASNDSNNCTPQEDETASIINENSDLLSEVLMEVCQEYDLPVALKIGAHRSVNPRLGSAGDGVVSFADSNILARLCSRFPKVRFLATFLSKNNQHEACVLASKFRNLHIYGCWWFCNNPSLIQEITRMRVEMLGTAFTAQHSDARVLDQLIYKWSHSRAVIAQVLAAEYVKLCQSGWSPTRGEVRRDVERLFGGSYEEFMSKSFA